MSGPVTTHWVVITGAPSSGKTSIIAELARRGYATQGEVARNYIEEQLADGHALEAIRGPDGVRLMQETIFARMLALQESADKDAVLFLDRGVPDSIAYFRLAGMDPAPVIAAARKITYRAVFMLAPLPLAHDHIRTEDDAAAQQLGEMFAADYASLGYAVVTIPVLPVAARTDKILSHLGLPALAAGAAAP